MRKLIATLIASLLTWPASAALQGGTHWSLNPGSTAAMVNGGGFNIDNPNLMTDGTVDAATGNTASPVFSSASYSFVAGDVNAWLYVSTGTAMQPWFRGWYKIVSVAANKATLNATAGQAVVYSTTTQTWGASTVVGVSTSATPTSAIFGVDYSQQTAAEIHSTDGTSTASTTFDSVTGGFTAAMKGNILHLVSATGADEVVSWFEIVNVTDADTLVLDRVSGTYTLGDFYIGGSLSLNSTLDDDWAEIHVASNTVWIGSGTYTLGETLASSINGTASAPIFYLGFNLIRGDNPINGSRPAILCAANSFATANFYYARNLNISGTPTSAVTTGASVFENVTSSNSSTVGNRNAFLISSNGTGINLDAVSYRGSGVLMSGSSPATLLYSRIHDSDVGVRLSNSPQSDFIGNLIVSNSSAAFSMSAANTTQVKILSNTFYGFETPTGAGFSMGVTGTTRPTFMNNIVVGFSTGTFRYDQFAFEVNDYNAYYNNTLDRFLWPKGLHDVTTAPGFTNVVQVAGITATTSGSVLTQASCSGFTSISAGRDYIYLVSGTGITTGIYGITAVNSGACTITLDIAPGTNATADKVFRVTTGRNFNVGTNYKAMGFPGRFQGGYTTGYLDLGAVQRQEQASGASTKATISIGN